MVDINYFPGLTTVPCRFDALLEHLARAAAAGAGGGQVLDCVRSFRLSCVRAALMLRRFLRQIL